MNNFDFNDFDFNDIDTQDELNDAFQTFQDEYCSNILKCLKSFFVHHRISDAEQNIIDNKASSPAKFLRLIIDRLEGEIELISINMNIFPQSRQKLLVELRNDILAMRDLAETYFFYDKEKQNEAISKLVQTCVSKSYLSFAFTI